MNKPSWATFEREYPRNTVADHEVFMSFLSDQEAIYFRVWYESIGADLYAEWFRDFVGTSEPSK